jgi:hypothetical protein
MLRRLLLPLLSLCLGVTRCGGDSGVVGPVTNRCARNADCAEGVCDLAQQRCVSTARPEVFFALAPAASTASVARFPTLTASRTLRSGDTLDLRFRGARTVYGTVRAPGAEGTRDVVVPATIEFVPAGTEGLVSPIRAVAGAGENGARADEFGAHNWSATLADGTYDVVVRPSSTFYARLPPRFERAFDVRSDALVQRFDITYPRTFTRWSGVVRDRLGNAVPGLSVRAVDPDRDGALLSTVASTDGDAANGVERGHFHIDLAPGAPDTWALRVSSDASRGAWLNVEIPAGARAAMDPRDMRLELSSLAGLPADAAAAPANGAPCNDCVEVIASVEGEGGVSAGRPLRDAAVTFRAPVTFTGAEGTRAWFECRATSEADGTVRAWLVPGDYDVIVAPPTRGYTTSVLRGFRVRSGAEQQRGQVFSVRSRIPVEGRALSLMGAPVANAHVTAVPFHDAYVAPSCLDDPDLRLLAARATASETTTNADGSYHVDVDPGLYRLLVEPLERSGYPATLGPPICVRAQVNGYDVALDAPVEVQGTVRDANGAPAPGASVEAVVRIRETGARGAVVRVGRTAADGDGRWTLRLPSSTVVSP